MRAVIAEDWPRVLAALDSNVELHQSRPSGVYRGLSGVQEAMQRWTEVWVDRRIETEEFFEAGDQIVVVAHEYAKSPRTGMALDRRITQVWTLRDGNVVCIKDYRDRDEALAAAGLS